MRYILNSEGYIYNVSFGAEIACDLGTCTEYTGDIPGGYSTIEEWFEGENEKLNSWKIVDGNLVFDENRANQLEEQFKKEAEENATATHKYVNEKLKQTNSIIENEFANAAQGTKLIKLDDSGDYNIKSLKIDISNENKVIQLKASNTNLIINKAVSQTIAGVDLTIEEDKTITLNGAAEDDINIVLNGSAENTDMLFLIKSLVNYYQSGMIDGTSIILNSYNGTDRTQISNIGNGQINLSEDQVVTEVILSITNGATFSYAKIKPILTISDKEEEYIEARENELIKIDLSEFTINEGDYLEFKEDEVKLISGKNEESLNEIISFNTFYPGTYIMIDKANDMSIEYYTCVNVAETVAEIKSSEEEIKLDLSKRTKNNEIFARMNMYMQGMGDVDEIPEGIEKSVIEFIANTLSIKTDCCELTPEGILTLKNKTTEPYKYTLNDAINVLNYLNGELSLSDELLELYDVNNDGKVSIVDAVSMVNISTGDAESEKYADAEITLNPLSPSEFIKMTLGGAIQCRIGLNEIYNYTFRGMNMFLGTFADMSNQYGVSINGENGVIKVTSEDAETETVIDAGMVDAYNVYASSGGGKGHCLHGIDMDHTYRCNWGNASGTNFFEVYVDDAQIPLIKSVPDNAQQISQMKLQTSYIEFIVPGYGAYSISGIAQSDTKLKENIEDSKVNALDIINKIRHIEFDWKDTKQALRKGHEEISFSANQILEDIGMDIAFSTKQPGDVEYDELLQIDSNRLIPIVTKAIQEADKKINEQQKMIDFLVNKLGCKEELEKYMKGEN